LLGYAFAIPAYSKYDLDPWQFERHKNLAYAVGFRSANSHRMFEKPREKSENHPEMTDRRKLNHSLYLLKSMEEYRQEYRKGMSLSHTLEDS